MEIKNRIKGFVDIDWLVDLNELQPDNLKVPYVYDDVKQSIIKHGFTVPFAVWNKGNKYYAIDGHLRKMILTELASEGIEVPKKLKAFEIDAKTKKEAVIILLECFNARQNPIDEPILEEWLGIEQIEVGEVEIETLNIKKPLRDIIGNDYEPEREVNNKDYCMVYLEKSHLAILQNIQDKKGFSDNEEAILYLIENTK